MMSIKRFVCYVALGASLAIAGCANTGSGYSGGGVGPSANNFGKQLGSVERSYSYNKDIFLDVAIPVINPGLPMKDGYIDEEALVDENIWPEIRRLESKRFSVNIRDALLKTKSFGAVRVVPGLGSSADLYVIGKINESNTLDTKIGITVVDATNKEWGEKDFSIEASQGFYRDARNEGKDPNRNLYTQIANWVYELIQKKKAAELENVKLVRDMRYAEMYSPQEFNQYLSQKRGIVKLNALPADTDTMLTRVREYQAQDNAFIDSLQENYDVFQAETEEAYRTYQKEALPIQVKIEQERTDRNVAIGLGILSTIAAVAAGNQETHLGDAIAVAGAVGAIAAIKGALDSNEAIGEFQTVFDEQGQNLDLQVSPQVRKFEDSEVELSGTAAEQYAQWQAHLLEVYRANETPDVKI